MHRKLPCSCCPPSPSLATSRHDGRLLACVPRSPPLLQRRRNQVDELNMRSLFKEGDLVSVRA